MTDKDLHQKVGELLRELRSWDPGEVKATVEDLAEQFGLDVFIVTRIATSEGYDLSAGIPRPVDPNASTLDLDPEAVQKAMEQPEEGDVDTGTWKRNRQTGEWELVPPVGSEEDPEEDPEDG
jgi:hypothetical protein